MTTSATSPGPDVDSDAAPPPESVAPAGATASAEDAPPGASAAEGEGTTPEETAPTRPRRRWLRVIEIVALVFMLPVAAFGIGLFVAWVVHQIRGDAVNTATGAAVGPPPTLAPAPAPKPTPAAITVPADWITEAAPPVGLIYRHPVGWIRRTALPEVLRVAPATPGSGSPGVEAIGAGIEPATDPAQAARSFAARAYGSAPGFAMTPAVVVTGRHPGEQQIVVTYRRAGVEVRVVIHSFRSAGRTVLALGRALNGQPSQAGQLEGFVEASLRFSG